MLWPQSWIGSDEKRVVHDPVRAIEIPNHAESRPYGIGLELYECGLTDEVPAEQHPIADLIPVQCPGQAGPVHPPPRLDGHHEAEPARIAFGPARLPREARPRPRGRIRRKHE